MRRILIGIGFVCLIFVALGLHAEKKKGEVKQKSEMIVSPHRFFNQLNEIDPQFTMPPEPIVENKKSYFLKVSKIVKAMPRPIPYNELTKNKDIAVILASKDLKNVKTRYLDQVSRIVSSSSAQCGYDPEVDFLTQTSRSIIGISDFGKVLRVEVLSAVAKDQRELFLEKQKQYLSYLQKNLDCSYTTIQLFIVLGQTKEYLNMINDPAIPRKFKDAAAPEIQKFQTWFANRFDKKTVTSFYPREAFSFFSGLFSGPDAVKEFFNGAGIGGEDNEEWYETVDQGFYWETTSKEIEKDFDKIKNDPESKVSTLEFLTLIYTPKDPNVSLVKDAKLFTESIRALQKSTQSTPSLELLLEMKNMMAADLYEELSLKDYGLEKSEDLVLSRELASLALEVLEKPKLRSELRKRFMDSEHAARYMIYLSLHRFFESSIFGAEERYAKKYQEILDFKLN